MKPTRSHWLSLSWYDTRVNMTHRRSSHITRERGTLQIMEAYFICGPWTLPTGVGTAEAHGMTGSRVWLTQKSTCKAAAAWLPTPCTRLQQWGSSLKAIRNYRERLHFFQLLL